jgi:multicomponent Na+:H+ antiporter subunit E
MAQILILAFPLAIVWVIFTRQALPQGFLVGYIAGAMIVWIVRANTNFEREEQPVRPTRILSQLWAILIYSINLTIEIFVSGIDVALRVLAPKVDVKPGLYRISTQDPSNNSIVSALSAHGITITPGTLVVDYEMIDGQTYMIVHTLDERMSDEANQIEGQTQRVKIIKRMMGNE